MPLSGTVGGTVGTALTNLEDRTHTHTGPSHTHGITVTRTDKAPTGTSGTLWWNDGSTTTVAGGTDATGTAATSNVMAYINQPAIVSS